MVGGEVGGMGGRGIYADGMVMGWGCKGGGGRGLSVAVEGL